MSTNFSMDSLGVGVLDPNRDCAFSFTRQESTELGQWDETTLSTNLVAQQVLQSESSQGNEFLLGQQTSLGEMPMVVPVWTEEEICTILSNIVQWGGEKTDEMLSLLATCCGVSLDVVQSAYLDIALELCKESPVELSLDGAPVETDNANKINVSGCLWSEKEDADLIKEAEQGEERSLRQIAAAFAQQHKERSERAISRHLERLRKKGKVLPNWRIRGVAHDNAKPKRRYIGWTPKEKEELWEMWSRNLSLGDENHEVQNRTNFCNMFASRHRDKTHMAVQRALEEMVRIGGPNATTFTTKRRNPWSEALENDLRKCCASGQWKTLNDAFLHFAQIHGRTFRAVSKRAIKLSIKAKECGI